MNQFLLASAKPTCTIPQESRKENVFFSLSDKWTVIFFYQFRMLSRFTYKMIQVIINLNLQKMNLARKKGLISKWFSSCSFFMYVYPYFFNSDLKMAAVGNFQQQQQQQHSFFSQASWGRLEMKPERNKFKVQAH